jgi:predicted ABC-type ATPase
MRRALSAGYVIDLSYLCLDSPSTNINRVARRVLAGGHHVPDRDVERRYHRSLLNLPTALIYAEHAKVYDNSAPSELTLLLEIQDGRLIFLRHELPDWLKSVFGMDDAIEHRMLHVEHLLEDLRKSLK